MPAPAIPSVIALAGPNGAGKSTVGPKLLKETLGVTEFVNADVIAQGLSGFSPESAAIAAGRIMLARLDQLAQQRRTFAFETTLAGRAYAPWLARLVAEGYRFRLFYLWLASPELGLARVADRVRMGGHAIPRETVIRRYHAGLRNFFDLYRPLTTNWRLYDNSVEEVPRLIATGRGLEITRVRDELTWLQAMGEPRRWDLNSQAQRSIDDIFDDGTPLDNALAEAVREALLLHKRLRFPIAVWRGGKVVWVPAKEIKIPNDSASQLP